MSLNSVSFSHFEYLGADAEKFLQGQVTVNITKLDAQTFQTTAICDLKGRIHFGLWLRRHSAEHIDIVISTDLADELSTHIKKFGAFSKAKLSEASTILLGIENHQVTFTTELSQSIDASKWQETAIRTGQAWITHKTSHLFQPQELRLHQRGGVDYDKGCYLGQEIIARLWFKAKPKHWLHLVQGQGEIAKSGENLNNDVHVVNSISTSDGWIGLVTAKPTALEELNLQVLALPEHLNGDVARPK